MIAAAARFLARVLVEFGLVLLLAGGLFLLIAYRTGRRFVSLEPDPLERYSRPAALLLELLGELAAARRT